MGIHLLPLPSAFCVRCRILISIFINDKIIDLLRTFKPLLQPLWHVYIFRISFRKNCKTLRYPRDTKESKLNKHSYWFVKYVIRWIQTTKQSKCNNILITCSALQYVGQAINLLQLYNRKHSSLNPIIFGVTRFISTNTLHFDPCSY